MKILKINSSAFDRWRKCITNINVISTCELTHHCPLIKMAAVVDSKDDNENNESEVLLKADDYNYYNLDTTVENDMFNPRTRLQIQTDRESTISDTDSALLLADPEVDTVNTDPDGREISTNHKNWHCHAPLPGEDKTARNQLIGVSVLCFAFMIAELAGLYTIL